MTPADSNSDPFRPSDCGADPDTDFPGSLRIAQVIRGALIAGVIVIVLVFAVIRDPQQPADHSDLLLTIGMVASATTIVASLIVPKLFLRRGQKSETFLMVMVATFPRGNDRQP